MRNFFAIAILNMALWAAGCVQQPDLKTQTNTTSSPAPVSSPSPSAKDSASTTRITLPLLDAFFADAGLYAGWLARNHHRAFLHALYTRSSMEETTLLKTHLVERNIAYATRDDGGPLAGVRLIEVETPHGEIAQRGPPAEPVGALLKRLSP